MPYKGFPQNVKIRSFLAIQNRVHQLVVQVGQFIDSYLRKKVDYGLWEVITKLFKVIVALCNFYLGHQWS